MKSLCKSLLIMGSFSLVAAAANAATVTKVGTDVNFTYDDATLFGPGFVVGNKIFFVPTDFKNESNDGTTVPVVTDTLNIIISQNTNSSFVIDAIEVAEFGDYILNGPGSTVAASLFTSVTSLTVSNPANTVLEQTGPITSPQDGSTNLWDLTNTNDWAWENETSILFQIQNNLTATTLAQGESAFIQKKQVPIEIAVMSEIPVPAAAWLFASAIAGLGLTRAKR